MTIDRLSAQFERDGSIRLSLVVDWMMQELSAAGSSLVDIEQLPPSAPLDVVSFFETEIEAAAEPRPWQAVLYATNSVIDYLWQILDENDRVTFMNRYAAAWMAYRVSIPVENASQLVSLAKQGRLLFRRGSTSVSPEPQGGFVITTTTGANAGTAEKFDMVIGAFGTPRDAKQLDSRLVQSILSSGLADAHKHGGLVVDPETNALVDKYGSPSNSISVLGELTSGIHFFTSVLEINARHAARLAKRIVTQLPFLDNSTLPLKRTLNLPIASHDERKRERVQ